MVLATRKSHSRMKHSRIKMRPIKFGKMRKGDVRTQFGAICYRIRNEKVQILLVTSRRRGRWIVPKGWPVDGATAHEAALTEAWEEAGVKGKVRGNVVGLYSYYKQRENADTPCVVALFPVRVDKLTSNYPEVGQRRRKWFSRKKAARRLGEPELQQIIRNFDPPTR